MYHKFPKEHLDNTTTTAVPTTPYDLVAALNADTDAFIVALKEKLATSAVINSKKVEVQPALTFQDLRSISDRYLQSENTARTNLRKRILSLLRELFTVPTPSIVTPTLKSEKTILDKFRDFMKKSSPSIDKLKDIITKLLFLFKDDKSMWPAAVVCTTPVITTSTPVVCPAAVACPVCQEPTPFTTTMSPTTTFKPTTTPKAAEDNTMMYIIIVIIIVLLISSSVAAAVMMM